MTCYSLNTFKFRIKIINFNSKILWFSKLFVSEKEFGITNLSSLIDNLFSSFNFFQSLINHFLSSFYSLKILFLHNFKLLNPITFIIFHRFQVHLRRLLFSFSMIKYKTWRNWISMRKVSCSFNFLKGNLSRFFTF